MIYISTTTTKRDIVVARKANYNFIINYSSPYQIANKYN